tara:strand:+ start:5864 stop:6847 length:984 start_codon:yes stop_codon:yes gene_type:complete
MSNTPQTNSQQEEIDLRFLLKKAGEFLKDCVKVLFKVLMFFKKYIIVVVILIIVGVSYGYYLDVNTKKVYTNEVIIIPNVESVDYLYSKVKALNSKIGIKDTIYLKKVLDTNFRKIKEVKIEPIVDVYNFISKSRENIDIFRIFTQNQDIDEYVQEFSNSKYFKYHKLYFSIEGKNDSEKIVGDVLREINENQHYKEYLEVGKENTNFQIEQVSEMIIQVDSIIKSTTNFASMNQSSQSVYINDNNQLGSLINIKRELLDDLLILKMKNKDEVEIVKEVSSNYNIVGEKGFPIGNKIKYPLLLVFLFSLFFFLLHIYKKLKAIADEQ